MTIPSIVSNKNSIIKRLIVIITFIILFIVYNMYSLKGETTDKVSQKVINKSLMTFSKLINNKNYNEFGLLDKDQLLRL
ncbi:MAG: hypothetical protein ABIO44_10175, partial [Saprospiraceae bacterium]